MNNQNYTPVHIHGFLKKQVEISNCDKGSTYHLNTQKQTFVHIWIFEEAS